MGDEEREDSPETIEEDRGEVAEEATPETDVEATEQRTDDYEGLARRLDEIMSAVRDGFDAMRQRFDALGLESVESTAYVEEGTDVDEIAEDLAEAVDELLGIDALDLL